MAVAAPAPATPRTPRPVRTLALIVFALFAVGNVAYVALILLELAARKTETVTQTHAGVRAVALDGEAGDIELVAGEPGSPVRVSARVTRSFSTPRHSERVRSGVLHLDSDCALWLGGACGVQYRVSLPPEVRVAVDAGAGDVTVIGIAATVPLRVHTGSGDIELRDVSAPSIELEVGSGDIDARRLTSPLVTAVTGSGDVELGLARPARSLRVDAGSGDVDLGVPPADYRIDADAGSGDVEVDPGLVRDDRSSRSIEARAGSGDVTVSVAG